MNNKTRDNETLLRFLQRGGSLRMLTGTDVSGELATLFRYARQLATAGEYAAAARLLKILTVYDAWSFEYWFELGVCCQADSAWIDAIYAYGRAAQIRLTEAKAPCAAGECYLACGNRPMAAKAFRAALQICGMNPGEGSEDNPDIATIRRRAQLGLEQSGE